MRGFEVRTRDTDEKVGTVDDLICSPDGRIRYLDVSVGGFFSHKRVALPVGAAQVDRANDVVFVDMTKDQAKALPEYSGDAASITEEYETGVRGAFASGAATGAAASRRSDADLYDQGRFYAERGGAAAGEARLILSEEELTVGKRQVQAGEVGLRKTVETEHVRESVPLVREEVTVERRPLSADAPVEGAFTEDEIRVPVMREEAVVEKRVVGKEEVILHKQQVTETQTVEADLRRERLEVDRGVGTTGASGLTGAAGVGRTDAGLSGAQDRATNSGPLDRLADKADDLKDRVDGNPASRPGPDATDRRI